MPGRVRIPVETLSESKSAEAPDDLSIKINQIFVQKGPFRNVTEQSVAVGPDIDEDSEAEGRSEIDESDDETREERQELLVKAREELFTTIHRGTLQCNQALDFISLFLSKHSRAAQGTFSDALKQSVKPGMLEGLYLDNARYAPTIRPKQELSKGWRTKSFISASEKLQGASKRLKREADNQSSFWRQVADVGNDGWNVCRHPRNRREMGVHFAMPESAPQFRNQGFTTLRQDSESTLHLSRPATSKRVYVDITRSGEVTGRYIPRAVTKEGTPVAIRELIDARDSLVDEELFHELGREARLAANQGIITRDASIEFSINDEYTVIISFRSNIAQTEPAGRDSSLAQFVGLSLRSLLVQAHLENHRRRTRPPAPISLKPFLTPEYAILRPLLAALRHCIAAKQLKRLLQTHFIAPLQRASLTAELEDMVRSPRTDSTNPDQQSIISTDAQQDTYAVILPNGPLDVKVTTYLGRPIYGTIYEIPSDGPARYDSLQSFAIALSRVVSANVVAFVAKETSTAEAAWQVIPSYKSEMRLKPNAANAGAEFDDEHLSARLSLLSGMLTVKIGGKTTRPWTWNAESVVGPSADSVGESSLLDVVRSSMRSG